jgi:hypothetical protein
MVMKTPVILELAKKSLMAKKKLPHPAFGLKSVES